LAGRPPELLAGGAEQKCELGNRLENKHNSRGLRTRHALKLHKSEILDLKGAGLSQEKIAKRLRISPMTVSRAVRDRK
jgi:DNA-binding CsgD family transcriptional regulator